MNIRFNKYIVTVLALFLLLLSCDRNTMNCKDERVPENRVIYEVFVRNFSPEGDLKVVEPQIPRLKELGVDIYAYILIGRYWQMVYGYHNISCASIRCCNIHQEVMPLYWMI